MTQSEKALLAAAQAVRTIDPQTVIGWGVDADPENDPTWPMRNRAGDSGPDMDWERPPIQIPGVEILQSVEHLHQPAVVGTSTPPTGLSGQIRRQAFTLSEGQWGHWLLLMLADRVNMIEGVAGDLKRGRLPNPLVEGGLVKQAQAREAAVGTAAVIVVVTVATILLYRRRR